MEEGGGVAILCMVAPSGRRGGGSLMKITRRQFVKSTAAGVVTAYIVVPEDLLAVTPPRLVEDMGSARTGKRYEPAVYVSAARWTLSRTDLRDVRGRDTCFPDDGPSFRAPASSSAALESRRDAERRSNAKAAAASQLAQAAPLGIVAVGIMLGFASATPLGRVVVPKVARVGVKEAVKAAEREVMERQLRAVEREIRSSGDRARMNFRSRDVIDHYDARPDRSKTLHA